MKLYKAEAQIMIEDERAMAVPGLNNTDNTYYEDPEPYYNTQYRILRGRDLTRRVVKKLNLGSIPEFNGTATPPTTPATMVQDAQKKLAGLFKPSASELIAEAPRVDENPDESSLVSAFVSRVEVNPVRGSRLVDVTFTAMEPKFAADAVNTLVDEYVEQNLR